MAEAAATPSLTSPKLCVVRAWSIHLYTALGLVAGFHALLGASSGSVQTLFVWLGIAGVIDSTDGMLARRFRVRHWTPRYDGERLDDITDIINCVLVPMFCYWKFGLISEPWLPVLGLVMLVSGYAFCMESSYKQFYTGFPCCWNVVLFYSYLFHFKPETNEIILLFLAASVFFPLKFISPSQTRRFRLLNIIALASWFICAFLILFNFSDPSPVLVWLSLVPVAWYFGASVYLTIKSR